MISIYYSRICYVPTRQVSRMFLWNHKNMYAIHLAGIVVQSVRAPPCQGGSCGFEPRQSRTRIRWIHFSIFRERGDGEQKRIPARGGDFDFFCFCFAFIIRQIREFQFLLLVLIDKGETYVDWYNQSAVLLYSDWLYSVFSI